MMKEGMVGGLDFYKLLLSLASIFLFLIIGENQSQI
jgi:hypothetical protein